MTHQELIAEFRRLAAEERSDAEHIRRYGPAGEDIRENLAAEAAYEHCALLVAGAIKAGRSRSSLP